MRVPEGYASVEWIRDCGLMCLGMAAARAIAGPSDSRRAARWTCRSSGARSVVGKVAGLCGRHSVAGQQMSLDRANASSLRTSSS